MITLGTVEPGDPLEFLTHDGLLTPGATGFYRVYVVLTTGNEEGSKTVAITRPLPCGCGAAPSHPPPPDP